MKVLWINLFLPKQGLIYWFSFEGSAQTPEVILIQKGVIQDHHFLNLKTKKSLRLWNQGQELAAVMSTHENLSQQVRSLKGLSKRREPHSYEFSQPTEDVPKLCRTGSRCATLSLWLNQTTLTCFPIGRETLFKEMYTGTQFMQLT